jgi:hypothetical protein
MSRIQLHIERLVLDGLRLYPAERTTFQEALERELTRLLAENNAHFSAGTTPRVVSPPVSFSQSVDPHGLARDVARSIHAGIGDVADREARPHERA